MWTLCLNLASNPLIARVYKPLSIISGVSSGGGLDIGGLGMVLTTLLVGLSTEMACELATPLELGDTRRLSLESNGFSLPDGFCSDSTCADSDRYGLDTCWISSGRSGDDCCGGATDTDALRDTYEGSRRSDSLVDFVERERHFQKRLLEDVLLRGVPMRWRSAQ